MIRGGPVKIYRVFSPDRWELFGEKAKNLTMYAADDCLGQLMSGNNSYRISTMYFEFANGSYSPPSFTQSASSGQAYYNGLSVSPNADFIRVPISQTPTLQTSDSTTYVSNQILYSAYSSATSGYWGKPCTAAAGSQIYGGALVVSPTANFSGDLVYARFYFASPMPVVANAGVGLNWPTAFE